ncbi:MAG: ceramidase domain-containing protein [Cryobacterium sp.]|nr:ceramidase domain-containing protein [Cryobacterium sp.]MBX3104214.1 ceramidase domain-containing protein [Cryobacterium sp.]
MDFPRQIANSFSSFAFVVLAIWGALVIRKPSKHSRERKLWPFYLTIMVFIGATSFYYHATLSFFGQFLDVFSMFLLGVLLITGGLYRSGRLSGRAGIFVFVIASSFLGFAEYVWPDARRILFALVLVAGVVVELNKSISGTTLRSRRAIPVLLAVTFMIIAFVIWTADLTGWVCDPTSIIQGHAVWHLLTAIAAYLVLFHYRNTEHRYPGPQIEARNQESTKNQT